MHNLQLNEDQDLIVDTVRKFVADAIAPKALDQDEHRQFAREQFEGLAELGLFGLPVAEANGGAGMGMLPYVAALEAIGAHSSSLARLWIGQIQCALALEATGSERLEAVAGGALLAAFVGPENGLSYADGKLSGTAELVPGALEAGLFVVAATASGQPVLLAVEAAGCKRAPLRSLGLASAAPARVEFRGVAATVLGNDAAAAIARAELAAWIGVAATAVGGGTAAVQLAKKHASERIAFGKPLLVQEAVVRKLVESQRALDGARQLVWHAARLTDLGSDAVQAALQARIAAVDAMVHAADEAIQILGGYGYVVEYHVERHYRDGKTLEVLDGGSDRMRNRLAMLQFA